MFAATTPSRVSRTLTAIFCTAFIILTLVKWGMRLSTPSAEERNAGYADMYNDGLPASDGGEDRLQALGAVYGRR